MAGWAAKNSVVVLLAACAYAIKLMASASPSMEDGFESCENIVQSWADSSYASDDEIEAKQLRSLHDFLFFLHVPRTGGFALTKCLLMQLYHDKVCPITCDMQGWDSRKPKCRVHNAHGDYSLLSKLPKKRTSVVTMVRHPLDRVISIYELSTVRAARYLLYPNMTSATEAAERQCYERPHDVCLLDMWPFKHLMPRLAVELFARRDARRNQSMMSEEINPYNINQIAMPLHDFVNDPLVHELVHNAITLQVAGLTEKSCLEESHAIRHCLRMHPSLGNYVCDVAKKRLDKMFFVGLTEKHRESMEMFAQSIEVELQSLTTTSQEKNSSLTDVEIEKFNIQQNLFTAKYGQKFLLGNPNTSNGNMTVEKLMEAYDACAPRLQELRTFEYTHFLKEVYPINFSKKARKQIQDSIIQQILLFNKLDIELHKHAEAIFKQQHERLKQRLNKVVSQKVSSTSNWLSKKVVAGTVLLSILALLLYAQQARSKLKDN
ncbi:protein-tyrosine sulfotransferase-like isoform X2 [Nymphaea colorata]|uniref:protein-tyrosine sulfotransferase-like isoform X2 n=1 Tax=Nymphaea colorata TaxID=210225 RepID=UPI00129DD802|nr:protein-tyrosine sulfotransferase-like isoform X2 [Nymphaea colorata]